MTGHEKDQLFCDLAVDLGFVTREQASAILEQQKVDAAIGRRQPIGTYFFDQGLLSREQIAEIVKGQEQVEYERSFIQCRWCMEMTHKDKPRCQHCNEIVGENHPIDLAKHNVPNYLQHAVAVTLCCCMPIGIVAIVQASQVNTKLQAGDLAGARQASDQARFYCWLGLILGLPVQVLAFIIQVAAGLAK